MIKATVRITPVQNKLDLEFGYEEGHTFNTQVREYEVPIETSDYADALNMALELDKDARIGFGVGATYMMSVEFE